MDQIPEVVKTVAVVLWLPMAAWLGAALCRPGGRLRGFVERRFRWLLWAVVGGNLLVVEFGQALGEPLYGVVRVVMMTLAAMLFMPVVWRAQAFTRRRGE